MYIISQSKYLFLLNLPSMVPSKKNQYWILNASYLTGCYRMETLVLNQFTHYAVLSLQMGCKTDLLLT